MPNTPSQSKQHPIVPTDHILCGEASQVLKTLPSNSIDLVVTSPPYDNLRQFHGYTLDLHRIGQQLHRVLRYGGVAVMVIQDQTKHGAKSLTSFRTIINWCDNAGFRLFETIIYQKKHPLPGAWRGRYRVDHEYMPIFVKGHRPAYFDKRHLAVSCIGAGSKRRISQRQYDGSMKRAEEAYTIQPTKCRGTIWSFSNTTVHNKLKRQHPATFSDQLAADFIRCFCPEGGVVLDPFLGSGTTAVSAKKLGRHYLGIELSSEYCEIARQRLSQET